MSEEIKDQKITIRVSPTEKKEIEAKAEQAKMSMSRYLVAATENKKIRVCHGKNSRFVSGNYKNRCQRKSDCPCCQFTKVCQYTADLRSEKSAERGQCEYERSSENL